MDSEDGFDENDFSPGGNNSQGTSRNLNPSKNDIVTDPNTSL